MTTLKQLEALAAIAETGSIEGAAKRLGVVHSAVSRQIGDLEATFGYDLLDRGGRSVRLTVDGVEVLTRARTVLQQRDLILDRIASKEIFTRRLRLGVTELTALTWLPRLVTAIRQEYPRVTIEPEVDLSAHLRDRLHAGQLDLIVVPDAFRSAGFVRSTLSDVQNSWFCGRGSLAPTGRMHAARLADFTLLTQGSLSGSGLLIGEWLKKQGVVPHNAISSNSLLAVVGMVISGHGIAYLPRVVVQQLVDTGSIREMKITPKLPPIRYVAMTHTNATTAFLRRIVDIAKRTCDFERHYQGDDGSYQPGGA